MALMAILIVGCTKTTTETAPPVAEEIYTVEITADGYNPSTITIDSGDAVRWINKDSNLHWIASAQHPTHAAYPESGGCIGSKFDACKGLKEGEEFTFVFNQVGEWSYHDHLNLRAPFFGKVIVKSEEQE